MHIEEIREKSKFEINDKIILNVNNVHQSKESLNVLKFINDELPNWFDEHDISFNGNMEKHIMNILNQVLKVQPEILQEIV